MTTMVKDKDTEGSKSSEGPKNTSDSRQPPEPVPPHYGDLFADSQPVRKGAISAALNDAINSHRTRLAPFFNGHAKPNPSISFANDGTGFGKSYNLFDLYIEHSAERGTEGTSRLVGFLSQFQAPTSQPISKGDELSEIMPATSPYE